MIQVFKPFMGQEEIDALAEVIRSGWIGLGPKTAEFEEKFAAGRYMSLLKTIVILSFLYPVAMRFGIDGVAVFFAVYSVLIGVASSLLLVGKLLQIPVSNFVRAIYPIVLRSALSVVIAFVFVEVLVPLQGIYFLVVSGVLVLATYILLTVGTDSLLRREAVDFVRDYSVLLRHQLVKALGAKSALRRGKT